MTLYDIDRAILACVDEETGEIIDVNRLEELEVSREAKIENICLWIKNLEAEKEAYKKEKEVFENKRKVAENKAESLKKYIADYLAGEKFKTTKVQVSWRKSESLEILDTSLIPSAFLKYYEPEVNKVELKKFLKCGAKVEGACLVEKINIQIK